MQQLLNLLKQPTTHTIGSKDIKMPNWAWFIIFGIIFLWLITLLKIRIPNPFYKNKWYANYKNRRFNRRMRRYRRKRRR